MINYKVALILGLWMFSITANSANPFSMKDAKTIYTASMSGRNAGCQLLINNIPVLKNEYAGSISKFLINPWLINGQNTFKLRMLPADSATKNHPEFVLTEMFCKVTISLLKEDGTRDSILASVEVSATEADQAPSKTGEFPVILGYSQPPWAQSEKIGRDSITQRKILDKYREFYRLLETKDLAGIMQFSAAKFQEYSKSMYDPDFVSDKKASITETFASPPGTLISIDEQKKFGLQYEYYNGDRLVSINNDEDRSIIQYYDSDEGVTTQYKLYFYFDGKELVLIL